MDEDVIIEADGSEELNGEGPAADTKMGKLKTDLEHAKKEKQEYLDGWQRAKADYVNALKRFEEEKKMAVALGQTKAILLFMPAIDSLERARQAGMEMPAGFEAIAKQLESARTSLGLAPVGTVGEKFDPSIHEALGQDPVDTEEKDDTVTLVLEPGWKAGENIIRPAKVRVGHFEG
jgi:molecular chaperone GrpE